jgi:hypothetical protein
MRGPVFHFAYVLTVGDRIVHFGASAVAAPEPAAVKTYLVRVHVAELFWDGSDHQFCPSSEVATELVHTMEVEYALLCPEEETPPA